MRRPDPYLTKAELVDGATYTGVCRNAKEARWDAGRAMFVYRRRKFGFEYDEDIRHPEDDDGFDLFYPVARK